ncbi:MAG TPA: hypothetical protein VM431_14855 [Phycisphaerae bacterium]|nr:hypothetical protein [Phycisphaerae bacterium]
MAVICIAGISPGIGKTSVAELLLGELEGWHVARVRVADEIGEVDAERLAETGHLLLTHPADTPGDAELDRLAGAAGRGASVLVAEPRGLAEGLAALRRGVPQDANLLIEGNAFLWADDADLAIMVLGPGRSGKGLAPVRPSVRELFAKIGVWVWNTRTNPADEGFFEFPQTLARMGYHRVVSNRADFHHVSPKAASADENAQFLDAVRERLEGAWWRRGSDEFLRRIGFGETGPG